MANPLRICARFRRLARDYERLSLTLAGFHYVAFAYLMLASLLKLIRSCFITSFRRGAALAAEGPPLTSNLMSYETASRSVESRCGAVV